MITQKDYEKLKRVATGAYDCLYQLRRKIPTALHEPMPESLREEFERADKIMKKLAQFGAHT